LLSVSSKPGARLSKHLNDMFCMSHFHDEEDGLVYLHEQAPKDTLPSFSGPELKELQTLANEAQMTPEIAAYLHNIVVFMRSNRYINGGVTATATRQLRVIAKVLAPLHGLNYVPPSLVALACHKIYPHRLILATAQTERSLQWGSDPRAIKQLLEGMTIESALDDVLASVETPL
jgi:MoxR-like ATPase